MKTGGMSIYKFWPNKLMILIFTAGLFLSCEKEALENQRASFDQKANKKKAADLNTTYEFSAPVYDIAAAPDGSILVGVNEGENRMIQQIKNGERRTMAAFETATAIQGLAPLGAGNLFVTTGGADLAVHGELYRVSNGNVRMVADLAAFEKQNDPDAYSGIQWKDQKCEGTDGFTAGPQNNPFNVVAMTGGKALVADAAGNTLLSATTTGDIDWKAIFTPPVDDNGEFRIRWYAEGDDEEIPCYVQPVPTSVAIGPDGYIYVGELTGAVAEGLPVGLSRIWRIPVDANNVVCQEGSGPCEVVLDGLTSVIDLAFGPDGLLYVVEFDENSWIASFDTSFAAGGTITAYDLEKNKEYEVATGLSFPSAITFDKKGNLWLLENNFVAGLTPTLKMLEY